MRDSAHIWEGWRRNALSGEFKPCTRVTVEKSFELRASWPVVGTWKRGPARWFQRSANDQVETEIPNILNVSHQSSIDSDAGQADIVVLNVVPQGYGVPALIPGQFGDLGHFSFDHGVSPEAQARWSHAPNQWLNVLAPNALIRIYQGFGGHDKDLDDAVEDGNLVLNGVFLVDTVSINTAGTIHLNCRDMAKLLIDQNVFPPSVPKGLYPLKYCRYTFQNFLIPPDPKPSSTNSIITETCEYGTCGTGPFSSTDEFYGEFDSNQTGHNPSQCLDWSSEHPPHPKPGDFAHQLSYWLSEPKSAPTDTVWIQFCTAGNDVNLVYLHPWGGNYRVQVSVKENGEWVAPESSGQGGLTEQGIPYVCSFACNWEGGQPPGVDPNTYPLPRDYRASEIRLTFTNLIAAQEGGFRAGARKIVMLYDLNRAQYPALSFAAASLPYNTDNRTGYWQVRSNGRLFAFGDARLQDANSAPAVHDQPIIGMSAHPDGLGYWTVDYSGRVVSYGSAAHYGDSSSMGRLDVVDIAPTPSGYGYWLLHKDGQVDTYGDAIGYGYASVSGTMPSGSPVIARSIESHPSTQGYWVLLSDGTVQEFNLTNYGSANRVGFTTTEYVASIRRTHDGAGYWIPSGGGIVQAFGNAPNLGNAPRYPEEAWVLGLCWDFLPYSESDHGYAVQYADGNLAIFGDFETFGSFGEGSGRLRQDGNYKDYADIIRELALWAGFWLQKSPQPGNERPEVYGNIEDTGAFAKDCLPPDMFDKKPILEAMKMIKEVVGYIIYVDQEGGFRFESPNWWSMGNFHIDGTPFDYMPEIDELVNLFDYTVSFSDRNARSQIIIASAEVTANQKDTVVTDIVPPSASDLRGIIRPAEWSNGVFTDPAEQKIMADLIAMHMWFSRRQSDVQCTANPLIGINDQVRIYERQTGETNVHYVRGVTFSHDLVGGDFTMNLQTHWMGGSPYGKTPQFYACCTNPAQTGYWQVDTFGTIHAFGTAELQPKVTADSHSEWVVGIRSTPSGDGYYTLDVSGKILAYGDAVHHGDLVRGKLDVKDFALTPSGGGYWMVLDDGTVHNFGDATDLGSSTVDGTLPNGEPVIVHGIESHPTDQGYWILTTDGAVDPFGLPFYGDALPADAPWVSIRATASGNGYWLMTSKGQIVAAGDASNEGNGTFEVRDGQLGYMWDFVPREDDGYILQRTDGKMQFIGDSDDLGMVEAFSRHSTGWSVVSDYTMSRLSEDEALEAIAVNNELARFLQKTASPSANNAVTHGFGEAQDPTFKAPVG